MFGQPPATDNSENKTADEDGEDDTGFINLCAPSRGRQWHDLPLSQVKELARRARSHHHALADHAMNNIYPGDVKETVRRRHGRGRVTDDTTKHARRAHDTPATDHTRARAHQHTHPKGE